jgi:hypothetical protein
MMTLFEIEPEAPAVSAGVEFECGMVAAPVGEMGAQRLNGRCRSCKARMSVLAGTVRGLYGPVPGFVRPDGLLVACADIRARCSCGGWAMLKRVQGTVSVSTRCDSRCEYAIGHKCDCQCGGANHGAGHHHN